MSTLTSLNVANLTIARGRVSLWATLPNHRRGWCTIGWLVHDSPTRRVVSSRNVVFDEAVVFSMGESNAEQRNDDEEDIIPRTMCSEEPDTSSGESPLRNRCNIPGRWQMNGTCIRGRLHVQGIIFDPLPHHSNAYRVQGIISVQWALREMDGLREVPQL
jgi:hypothetical protein